MNADNVRPTYTSLGKPIDYDTCATMCGSDTTCLAFQHNHFLDGGGISIDHCYRMTTETIQGDMQADRACCCVKRNKNPTSKRRSTQNIRVHFRFPLFLVSVKLLEQKHFLQLAPYQRGYILPLQPQPFYTFFKIR